MIHAFADDSVTDHVVTCGVLVLPEGRVASAEELLAMTKQRFGLPPEVPLHCRVMFAGDARRGTPWEGLSPERISELVHEVCAALKDITERPLVAVIDPHAAPPQVMSPGGEPRRLDVKEVASFAHMSTTTILAERYGPEGFRVWTDPDRTQIPWAEGRRRADRTRSPFIDLGPEREPPRLTPIVEEDPKRRLLEVADLYAYATAQAFSQSGGQRTRRFQQLYLLIDPELLRFQWNEKPEWEDA
jgi:hypothetical protein